MKLKKLVTLFLFYKENERRKIIKWKYICITLTQKSRKDS